MRTLLFGLVVLASIASPALAWNEKGHMVIARLAWLKLSPQARAEATRILKTHPHYDEFLKTNRPPEFSEDEWVFMRASYWPDWVRGNYSEIYSFPTWHYVTVGYVPPQSKKLAEDLPTPTPNVVTQIPQCIAKLKSGHPSERSIYLCWLLHLVGDIHQPLHCGSLLSEVFPEGDQGGNLSLIRIENQPPARLHFVWDALLGDDVSAESISKAVSELSILDQQQAEQVASESKEHPTAQDWAAEGLALVKQYVYLNGDLRTASVETPPPDALVPSLSQNYLDAARRLARDRAVRAGNRLAGCIQQVLN